MDIWHKLMFKKGDGVESLLNEIGAKYVKSPLPGGHYVITFEIKESDPNWPQIFTLMQSKKDVPDLFNTVFTNTEILQAEWVRLQPTFQQGYPQPEDDWREYFYTNQCPKCGIGYTQQVPFHIKQEPKMGKNDFWSLYWAYTLFCTIKVLQALKSEQIKGHEIWPVIIHNTNEPSEISQLLFPNIANSALADEDKLQPETCSECGVTKYLYHKKGYMHLKREALLKNTDSQLTNEWFGSGGYSGFREILISNRLAKLIIDDKLRGVSLKPTILY